MKRGFLKSSKAQSRPLGPVPAAKSAITDVVYGKFPIGKIQVDVPEGVETKFQVKECDPRGGSTPGAMTLTTLPIGAEEDEPVSECLFFPGSKEVVMNFPGFPQPLIQPATPAFRMATTPGKGVGLFSTRALKFGDLILGERPLYVGARGVHTSCPENLTREQVIQHSLNTLEKYLEISVSRMRPAAKAAFMALANSHKEDGSGPIAGIVRTNAVALVDLCPDMKGEIGSYSAVCKDISRLNHSCSPNTISRFDKPSFSYQLYAVRDIAKGEELTYQYTDVVTSTAERRKALKPYDFVCTCAACEDAPASDARRAAISAFRPNVLKWAFDRTLSDNWLPDKCREHLALIAREGLEQMPLHFDLVKTLMEAHICLGDAQGASEWAAKVERFQWEEVRPDVKALLDPASAAYQAHPMWRVRADGGRFPIQMGGELPMGGDIFKELKALALKNGGTAGPWGMVIPMK
ncbi:hypothetical protein FB451DRAFT_1549892 [Mycena latifolia]|nr:hypothetical protein FB451DRAFT_1549892 [Mycena latifolia]